MGRTLSVGASSSIKCSPREVVVVAGVGESTAVVAVVRAAAAMVVVMAVAGATVGAAMMAVVTTTGAPFVCSFALKS